MQVVHSSVREKVIPPCSACICSRKQDNSLYTNNNICVLFCVVCVLCIVQKKILFFVSSIQCGWCCYCCCHLFIILMMSIDKCVKWWSHSVTWFKTPTYISVTKLWLFRVFEHLQCIAFLQKFSSLANNWAVKVTIVNLWLILYVCLWLYRI